MQEWSKNKKEEFLEVQNRRATKENVAVFFPER